MKKVKFITLLLGAAVISGCATKPQHDASAQIEANREARELLAEMKAQRDMEKQESKLDKVPDWYLNPPKSDGVGVYGVGAGESNSLRVALTKSMLLAKRSAAQQLAGEVSSLTRSYTSDRSDSVRDEFSDAIEELVSKVKVVGYSVAESEQQVIGNKYLNYYLIHVPYNEFNDVFNQVKSETEVSPEVERAFAELERKVDSKKSSKE